MSDAITAGAVKVKVQFELDNEQLRAVAQQGRAELEQQMAGVSIDVAARAQSAAAGGQASPSPALLSNLPPVATGAGGGATSQAMAQATRQARLDASRARMSGGKNAQIDSLIRSAQAIGGQAGEWLETAATMMFAQTREAFTRSAQVEARRAEQRVARDKNAINRVALSDATSVSKSALSIRDLDPAGRTQVLARAQQLRTEYGVDYKTSVAAAARDYRADLKADARTQAATEKADDREAKAYQRRGDRFDRNRDLAGLAQQKVDERAELTKQKQDEKAVSQARNAANRVELQGEKERATMSLKARDLTQEQLRAVQDRARELQRTHGTSFKESFGAAMGEMNAAHRAATQLASSGERQRIDQFLSDIASDGPGEQRRSIRDFLRDNPNLHPRDRVRLERQRNQLFGKTTLGQFLGEPSAMGLMLNTMFGGIELGHAALAFGRGSNMVGAENQFDAYKTAADSIAGGFLGSFANMVVDPFGSRRTATEAIAQSAKLDGGRTALQLAGSRAARDATAAADAARSTGYQEQLLAGKAQAQAMRDQADDTARSFDEQTDKEVANKKERMADTREQRVMDRYLELNRTMPADAQDAVPIDRQRRLTAQAERDVDTGDQAAVSQFRGERNRARDKVTTALRTAATDLENATADKVAFQIKRFADANNSTANVMRQDLRGDPYGAQLTEMYDKHRQEWEDLNRSFGSKAGTGDPGYTKAASALTQRHFTEHAQIVLNNFRDLTRFENGTRAITEATAGRALESQYAAIDSQLGVVNINGRMMINGISPGAQGYQQQLDRRNAMRTQARVGYQQDLIRNFASEQSMMSMLNHQPLQAQFDQIIGDATAATRGMSGRSTEARRIWRQAGVQIELAKQRFNEGTQDVRTDQLFETKSLTRQLLNDPVGAEAYNIAGGSLQRARALYRSGRPEDAENERKLGNARLDVLQGKYADSFEAVEFDPRTSWFDAQNGQDPNAVFGSIDSARAQMNNGSLSASDAGNAQLLTDIRDAIVDLKNAWDQIKP